jgi:hypothetical protein
MATRRGPDNSARVAISGTANSVNWANIFHVQLLTSSSIAQADLDSWLNTFQANYKTRFSPSIGSSAAYSLAKAVLYTPGGGELISTVNMTGTGSGSTGVVDNSACFVVSWNTTVYWRGGKPRTYLPIIPAGAESLDYRTTTSASRATLTTAAVNFKNDVNAQTIGTITGSTFGFVSFSSGNAPRATPLFFAITGATIHPRYGTQRRRLGKWLS